MRYKLTIEYDGSAYHGWQLQPNAPTVQGVLEAAVHQLSGETVRVVAAGRTDAGVHASGQVVSFSLQHPKPLATVVAALNALTPRDISIAAADIVADDFDPRRRARSRVYVYRIWNTRWPSPFWRRYSWHVAHGLEVAAMQTAALALVGEHDFSTFRAAGCDAEHPIRRVLRSEITPSEPLVTYTIDTTNYTGDRLGFNQVGFKAIQGWTDGVVLSSPVGSVTDWNPVFESPISSNSLCEHTNGNTDMVCVQGFVDATTVPGEYTWVFRINGGTLMTNTDDWHLGAQYASGYWRAQGKIISAGINVPIPEPMGAVLFGLGAILVARRARRR